MNHTMELEKQKLSKLSTYINNGSINFLVGSGLSAPFIPLLSENFEKELQDAEESGDQEQSIKLKKSIFTSVLKPNLSLLENIETANETLENYKKFVSTLHSIITERIHNLLHRQINIFTTNYDLLFECALESCGIEYNCGFSGHFFPTYNSDNFKKTVLKRGMFLDSSSEIPSFNIVKLHGSISWTQRKEQITLKHSSEIIQYFQDIDPEADDFQTKYNSFTIINPSNKKFLDTVLLDIYSDLLRLYSSELEKQNSLLFVCGFSFNDLHIQRLTLKAANANPTLKIFILAYEDSAVFLKLQKDAINNNIEIINKKFDIEHIILLFQEIRGLHDK